MEKNSVSIIVPTYNSETTILITLNSLKKQKYPIEEIIIVDNGSKDNTIKVINNYIKKNKKMNIILLKNKVNRGVGGSYNRGVNKSKSKLFVLMHSDSELKTVNELTKLVKPFKDKSVVASYSTIILPRSVWNTYNFWQKVLSSRSVDKRQPGLNGKFDCISKKIFKKVGGFNTKQYGHHIMVGADDSDLHLRLLKEGRVVKAESKVIHLHYLGGKYSLKDLIENRKLLARSYGRLLRLENFNLGLGALFFFVKPMLLGSLLVPFFYPWNVYIILAYIFWYYLEMYKSSFYDFRILLLPFVTLFLLFYEVYWMIESFLFLNKSNV